jgi:phosphoglycerol transferase MdoB-like AlkP superfamily enzyme
MNILRSRYSILLNFILFFLVLSFITRAILLIEGGHKTDIGLLSLFRVFGKGFVFDLSVALFFCAAYAVYLLLLPQRWNNSLANRITTYASFFIVVLIIMFSFFAEFVFWNEFESRFNFIAVDYLVYTFEVINNINQSYPLPWLISGMVLITLLVGFIFWKQGVFTNSFTAHTRFAIRLQISGVLLLAVLSSCFFVCNSWADTSANRYQNEISKAGIFSFFSAFRNNELNYYDFYVKEGEKAVFATVRQVLAGDETKFTGRAESIRRLVSNPGEIQRPNVILVTIESFSAGFMQHFGNTQQLTPVLDSLADKSILFTNMYATGTRTVRGMEALTLCVPPTPGNSIVRREGNDHLFNVSTIFRNAGYTSGFFYGGDGYFDNMNNFFGNNGFAITDRGGRLLPGEQLNAARTIIPDEQVHFENAWGICDEDLYDAVIRNADKQFDQHHPFFDFVMTTSNHRPFTYPEGKVDIPSGQGREGAVKYTDYAIGRFLQKIHSKPWFANTVVIFVADHCASSAGKNEINVDKYHIPCMVYNLHGDTAQVINDQCSQIDLFSTLFGLMHWKYESNWYGQNVLMPAYHPRAWVATYQKLGYLQHDSLVVLSPQRQIATYKWNTSTDEQRRIANNAGLAHKAIASYQTAYYLYKNGGMKE